MALTGEALVDEVQALVGRANGIDTVLITPARVTRWLNEAQRKIADQCPGLLDLDFKSDDSLDISTDECIYPLSELTSSDSTEPLAHANAAYIIDGANSIKLTFYPVDEFDELLIDPTSSEHSATEPTRWTRRGDNIEIAPRPSSDYNSLKLRVDGTRYAAEFTTNDSDTCEIGNADEGLIRYAVAEAWRAIGDEGKSAYWEKKWYNPLDPANPGWLDEFKETYARMAAWEGNLFFGDGEE